MDTLGYVFFIIFGIIMLVAIVGPMVTGTDQTKDQK